jgi:hypothetical protein
MCSLAPDVANPFYDKHPFAEYIIVRCGSVINIIFSVSYTTLGGWKISKERLVSFGEGKLAYTFFSKQLVQIGTAVKNVFEDKIVCLAIPFRLEFSWSFFSFCCNFFIIRHFPLQCIWGFALFSQFLA